LCCLGRSDTLSATWTVTMAPLRCHLALLLAATRCASAAAAGGTSCGAEDAESEACAAAAGRASADALAGVEDAGLLQVGRGGDGQRQQQQHRAARSVDSTKVWAELKAAVQVDKLRAALEREQDPKLVTAMRERLSELQQGFPATSDMKQHFAEQWANITMAVDLEEVQQRLQDAQSLGGEEVVALTQQLHKLQAHIPEGVSASIQEKAAGSWAYLQDTGVPLPDLDQVTSKSVAIADAAKDTAGWVYSSSAYVAGTMASTYGSVAKDVVGDIDAGEIAHSVQDAAGAAAGAAANKAGEVAGRVKGWLR